MLDPRLDHQGLMSFVKGAHDYLDTVDQRTSHLGEDDDEITKDSKLRIRLDAALQAVCELGEHIADQLNEEYGTPGEATFPTHYELEIR